MGTAGAGNNEEAAVKESFAREDGRASKVETDAASACHSFEEWEGTGAGTRGAGLFAGLAQQAVVEQQLVRQQPGFPPRALSPMETAKVPCHARTNPSRRTVAVFKVRAVMLGKESV
jgi:hypothetical protein